MSSDNEELEKIVDKWMETGDGAEPTKPISKRQKEKLKNRERVARARQNETPEKREARLAKARAYSAASRKRVAARNKEKKRKAESQVLEKVGVELKKGTLDQVPLKKDEGLLLNNKRIQPTEYELRSLAEMFYPEFMRKLMEPVLQKHLQIIPQNFCVSEEDLISSLQMTILGLQRCHILAEVPSYFDSITTGLLIRKKKDDILNEEKVLINDKDYIYRQFFSFFHFLFTKTNGGAEMIQNVRLGFMIRFPIENFGEVWEKSRREAFARHFEVVESMNPIDGTIVKIYKKKSLVPQKPAP